jgi:RimJ/RimL family protein N-acetyltransferase
MEVVRCATPEAFLATTNAYRGLDPIRANLLGSIAVAVAGGDRLYDAYWWWVINDSQGAVVGAALRTAPFGLALGPMPLEAAALLAGAVARDDDQFPWVGGNEEVATEFLRAYRASQSPGSYRVATRGRLRLVYELINLRVPQVEGACRLATLDDLDLVEQWSRDFSAFIEGEASTPSENDRAALVARVRSGMMSLWCVDGVPVAMAGHAAPVETPTGLVTRIGPVYTPAPFRGHGYGSAVTAALSATLLDGGSRVMLYTDADNPTSNGVYQRLGYERLDQVAQFNLVEND